MIHKETGESKTITFTYFSDGAILSTLCFGPDGHIYGTSIFVGDHPENDVIASRNVGMISIWKKDYQWDTFVTELYVNDLAELP